MTLGAGTEAALITDVAFWVIAVSSVVAALAVVQLKNVFRATLFLVVCFLGVAGMFVLLRAEFLAIVQVLIYVGAISVLIIFAILMTRDVEQGNPSNRLRIPAALLALLFLTGIVSVALNTDWDIIDDRIPEAGVIALVAEQGDLRAGTEETSKDWVLVDISIPPTTPIVVQVSADGDQTIRDIASRSWGSAPRDARVVASSAMRTELAPRLTLVESSLVGQPAGGLRLADVASDARSLFTEDGPPGGLGPQTSSERAKLSEETARMVESVYSNTIPELADMLLSDFVLAFEVASVLLLAAIIGALALVRER